MSNLETIFNTPGIGGAVACVVIGGLMVCYFLTLKWILAGEDDDTEE